MKATILKVKWEKEYETQYGLLHLFKVTWPDENLAEQTGFYSSKSKEQKYFVEGKESDFDLEEMKGNKGTWYKIKPAKGQQFSQYGKKLKVEQSKYAGFATRFCTDLVIAGRMDIKEILPKAKELAIGMKQIDKELEKYE